VLAAVLTAAPCRAQSTGAPPIAGPDSAVALPPGSAGTGSAGRESAGTDSAGTGRVGSDSAVVAPRDSLARQGADRSRPPASPVPPAAPVDSALGAACEETAQGPLDVLLVTFRLSATDSERSAVAQQVGGTLLGMSQHGAPGSWYLRVPGSADDPAVADRLILLSPVLEVGSTRCPS